MKTLIYIYNVSVNRTALLALCGFFMCVCVSPVKAQLCPPNIDFETGTFAGWTCFTGNTAAVGGQNVISLSASAQPVYNRHTMYTASALNQTDQYGGFPVTCPNGSGHSIRLGNNSGGGEAEGISYEFTIPANQDAYTLIYNYAVVFQEPNHQSYEQPRMEIEVTNVTDNKVISCASFTFIPYGTTLPGFVKAPPVAGDSIPVWYKDWSAVSVNLAGNAGKTIRLMFKSADCTFRRHFGYAYIDVNSECSGSFVGATYCPDDTLVNIVAPYGYQSYAWFNSSLTQALGNNQVLTVKPPPPPGTILAVKVTPYFGYGCPETFFAKLSDTLKGSANAGLDTVSCNLDPVLIGAIPRAGFKYKWTPAEGLTNPNIANPFATPTKTTDYILTTLNGGGGCLAHDTVHVVADIIDNSIQLVGKAAYCIGSGDSAILRVQPTDSIQWYKDNVAMPGVHQAAFRVTETGEYFAKLFNKGGCTMVTVSKQINISSIPKAGFQLPGSPNQCLVGNQFAFKNTSTNSIGAMQYRWSLGDGNELSSRDVTYSYTRSGDYTLKLLVSSNAICADSSTVKVTVYQNAFADFNVKPVCVELPVTFTNNTADTMRSTVNYVWNLGNGQTSNSRTPPTQVFSRPGNYTITLSVNTEQCPTPFNTMQRTLVIDKPRQGVTYPVAFALINYPLVLEARSFGAEALWTPGTNLDTRNSFTPVFTGTTEQAYNILITTSTGCVTSDTQVVKTVKEIGLFVPSAFTPNNDGKNDVLRPILMGIRNITYFRVYNRWGEMIHEQHGVQPGWDGTFHGVAQEPQTFVWMAEGIGVDNKTYFKKGTAVLVR